MTDHRPLRTAQNISDLPLSLRSYITRFLHNPPPEPHLELSLSHARQIKEPLPTDILPCAVSSPTLAAAVADLLGKRCTYLTRNVAKQNLALWTRALGPYVRALSFFDSEIESYRLRASSRWSAPISPHLSPQLLLAEAESTLVALTAEHVKLLVLDLKDAPFEHVTEERKAALENLVARVLEQSADSLEQLSVSVHDVCVSALEGAVLPKLKRLELHPKRETAPASSVWDDLSAYRILCHIGEVSHDVELLLQRMCGVTARSLNKLGMRGPLFENVTVLHMTDDVNVRWDGHDKVASFIAQFPSLKSLNWDGMFSAESARSITTACSQLNNVHWKPRNAYKEHLQSEDLGDPDALPEIFAALKDGLRVLEMVNPLFEPHTTALATYCPNLEHLTMEIGPKNAAAVKILLQKCRKIRVLSLPIMEDVSNVQGDKRIVGSEEDRMLRAQGWQELAEAVSYASEVLQEFSVQIPDDRDIGDWDEQDMIQAMANILRALGKQATRISFAMPLCTNDYGKVSDAVTLLLSTAASFCPNISHLLLWLQMGDVDWEWAHPEEKDTKLADLTQSRDLLERNAPRLQSLDLDGFIENATNDEV